MHALHPSPETGPKKTAPVLVEPGTGRYVLLCCQPAGGGKQECSEAAERHSETSRLVSFTTRILLLGYPPTDDPIIAHAATRDFTG